MTAGERVKHLRKDLLKLSGDKFSEPLGIGKSAISGIETGSRGLTDQMILSICRVYGCNEEWLRDGIGPPYSPKTLNQKIIEWVNVVLAEKDESIRKRFIHALTEMDDEGWKALDKFIEDLKS